MDYPQQIIDRIPKEWGKFLGIPEEWYPRVVQLDADLAEIDPEYVVNQVKEKFGGLRYYIQTSDGVDVEEMRRLIRQAEVDIYLTWVDDNDKV